MASDDAHPVRPAAVGRCRDRQAPDGSIDHGSGDNRSRLFNLVNNTDLPRPLFYGRGGRTHRGRQVRVLRLKMKVCNHRSSGSSTTSQEVQESRPPRHDDRSTDAAPPRIISLDFRQRHAQSASSSRRAGDWTSSRDLRRVASRNPTTGVCWIAFCSSRTITRPSIARKAFPRLIIHLQRGLPSIGAGRTQEVLDRQRNVFGPVAQRWHHHRHRRDAIKQIGSETAVGDGFFNRHWSPR